MQAVFVFGGIGAGKTTLSQMLARALNTPLVREPVDENPFLPHYAVDQTRWAFTCQTYYYLQYVREYRSVVERGHPQPAAQMVIDAGAPTNIHVYGRYMREQKIVTTDEFALYETLTGIIAAQYQYPEPSVIVHAIAPLETCLQRVRMRGREFELSGHTQDYVRRVAHYTDEMVDRYGRSGVPVVTYDTLKWDARVPEGISELVGALSRFDSLR
jgi:deoxyadenosine/deoxycytidine kinase